MPYIGRAATNAGSVNYLDDISSGFDGSDTTFTCAISGTTITPGQENVFIYLDGVFQDPGSSKAYTISGSTITFTEAPANGTVFTGYVAGEGAYLDDGTVSTAKLDDDAVTASKLDDDGTGFQVGDLGVGGSLTSGDKLTVTGRLRASGGIIGDITGDVTGNVTGNTSGTAATVTGAAQSNITSVGTLSSLTTSGSAGSAYVGSFTNTSATGWGLFVKGGADNADYTLRVQDKDAADLLSVKAGGRVGVLTNDPSHTMVLKTDSGGSTNVLKIEEKDSTDAIVQLSFGGDYDEGSIHVYNGGTSKINLRGNGASYINGGALGIGTASPSDYSTSADNLVVKNDDHSGITIVAPTNKSSNLFFADGTSGSEQYRGFIQYDHGNNLTDAMSIGAGGAERVRIESDGNVGLGGAANIGGWNSNYAVLSIRGDTTNYGGVVELANPDSTGNYFGSISFVNLDGGSSVTAQARISALPDGADDASAIVFETEPTGGAVSEKLRIRGSTTNWCLDVTSPSPYGLQISTTASNSSSHDMFKVKRNDGTACIETWGDGNTKIENEIQTKAGLRTYATNGASPTGDSYNVAHKFATYVQTVTASHVTDGYINYTSSIYRDNVIGVIANHFGAASSNQNHMGFQSSYVSKADLYAAGTLRAYIGSSVVENDKIYLTVIYHGNTG